MLERNITRDEVREVLLSGEMIEEYPETTPYPSALFLKHINKRPLHVLAALDRSQPRVFIITAYEPTLDKFESNFRTRRREQ